MLLMVTKVHSHAADTTLCLSQSQADIHHENTGDKGLNYQAGAESRFAVNMAQHELKCADRLVCLEDRSTALLRRDGECLAEALNGNSKIFISLLMMWDRLESLASVRRSLAPPASWVERIRRPPTSLATVHLSTVIFTV
jgi:hypothetical protein